MMPRDDDAVDRAVDAVARELTAGEPGSDLRTRVMRRIETSPRESRLVWRVAVPAAALAAVAMAVLVAPRGWTRGGGATRARVANTVPMRMPETMRPAASGGLRTGGEPLEIATARGAVPRTRGTAKATAIEPDASAVAALAPPRLSVDSLAVAPLEAPDSIHLEELPFPSIDVPALPAADPISQGEI